MTLPRLHTIRRPDGVTLDAASYGPAAAPPLVLLHGFSDSRRSFEPLIAALPDDLHIMAISQRGHGDSSKPQGGYALAQLADDVAAVLDTLGHEGGVIVGHSMGAWVAMGFAERHRGRARGLALIGAFAGFAGKEGIEALKAEIDALGEPVDPGFVHAFQEAASSPALNRSFFEMIIAESLKLPRHVWQAMIAAFLRDDVPRDLASFAGPSLLIWGAQDAFVPRADQEQLLQRLPGAWMETFPAAGHSPHWEDPVAVAALLEPFARGALAATRPEVTQRLHGQPEGASV